MNKRKIIIGVSIFHPLVLVLSIEYRTFLSDTILLLSQHFFSFFLNFLSDGRWTFAEPNLKEIIIIYWSLCFVFLPFFDFEILNVLCSFQLISGEWKRCKYWNEHPSAWWRFRFVHFSRYFNKFANDNSTEPHVIICPKAE